MNRKVIIVAPKIISAALTEGYPDWDAQAQVESIDQLWHGLNTGVLDNESKVVIIIDILFEKNPDAFVDVIASFAPEALVMILSYTSNEDIIRAKVSEHCRTNGIAETDYYFIQQSVAMTEIDETIAFYDNKDQYISDAQEESKVKVSVGENVRTKSNIDTSKNGLVVTCTSPKGGSGKTTVALLTATMLAQSSQKAYEQGLTDKPLSVVVVDLDVFDGQIGFVLGQRTPTALNIAVSESIIDPELIMNNLVYSERMGVHALLAPVRGLTAKITTPKFYRNVIHHLKTMFDVVIIDTSVQHYDDHIKTVALPEADAILLVTTLAVQSIMGLGRWLQVATAPRSEGGHGADRHKMGVVVNQSLANVGMGEKELAAAAFDVHMLVAIPLDTLAVQASGNANRLEDLVTHPTIGPAYYNLAKKIAKARGFVLAPLIVDADTAQAPVEPAKKSFFGARKR